MSSDVALKGPICSLCNHLVGNLDKNNIPKEDFLASTRTCSWCMVLFRAIQFVTDMTQKHFTSLQIYKEKSWFMGENTVDVRLYQKDLDSLSFFQTKREDPFPNDYRIYTPETAGEEASIPGLGLRNDPDDEYQELLETLDDRLALARTWYEQCTAEHPNCVSTQVSWPRRVLELGGDTIYLREHAARPPGAGYVALSYCWGKSANFKTLKANRQSHLAGIPVSKLPRTLADAVRVCNAFDIQYLWIDALCIIQDDRNDWMDQIPLMSDIYTDAHFVIAAMGATDVNQGCLDLTISKNAPFHRLELEQSFGNEPPRKLKLSIQESQVGYHVAAGHHSSRPDMDDYSPLLTRAWTFQERFLARRVLFCTPSELAWDCTHFSTCECQKKPKRSLPHIVDDYWGLGSLSTALLSQEKMPDGVLRKVAIWAEMIRQYSTRQLTNWEDRLAAIQGAVVALTRAFPDVYKMDDYIFGMWKPHMVRLLLWSAEVNRDSPVTKTTMVDKVPSWSWAKVPTALEYKSHWTEKYYEMMEIINIDCKMATSDIFGAGSGTLTIKGLLVPTKGEKPPFMSEDYRPEFRLPESFCNDEAFRFRSYWNLDQDDLNDKEAWKRVTHFVPGVGSVESVEGNVLGMFLEPVQGKDKTFRRVGVGYDYQHAWEFGDPEEVLEYHCEFCLE